MEGKLLEVNVKLLENLLKEHEITDIASFDEDFLVKYTYDAISLEGKNKMPFEKVKRLISLGAVSGFSEREVKEVLNHVAAFNYLLQLLKTKDTLDEEDIKDLHDIIQKDIVNVGVYRNVISQFPGAYLKHPRSDKLE